MEKKLRYGWTTGACAAAAARAAVYVLKHGEAVREIAIDLPKQKGVVFAVKEARRLSATSAEATITKDAGDDPDVTHMAEITCCVELSDNGVQFLGGDGVGTVTKAGLPLAVGEPAINPAPREQIRANLYAEWGDKTQGFIVTVSVARGEELAESTWNARLGIVGGLSILGTSGVVVPYSCSAWIHSIHRGIDVAVAEHADLIGAATGKQSDKALQRELGLEQTRILDMGDFVGGMLKYLKRHAVPRLVIAGGFGKMVKLGQGAMDLHSGRSQVDFVRLAKSVEALGGDGALTEAVQKANSALEVRQLCQQAGVDIAGAVATASQSEAQRFVGDAVSVSVLIVGRESEVLAKHG